MLKFKFLLIFLILSSICFSDEIIDNFFNQLKSLKEKAQFLRIETIETKISGEINFSDETFNTLKIPLQKIFQKEISKDLKLNGYFRGKISSESEKFEFSHLYIYIFSDLESLVFSQVGNDIQILVPSLGVILKDKKQNVENFINSQKTEELNTKSGPLPVNFLSSFFEYLATKEEKIKEKIKFEKESKREGIKVLIYNYPIEGGNIIIEIFDKLYTFSQVKIVNNKEKVELTLYYSIPEKEIKVSSYLPEVITFKSEKDKNKLILNFSDIQYNKLFSENDFRIKEMNFPELITSIYMKILK